MRFAFIYFLSLFFVAVDSFSVALLLFHEHIFLRQALASVRTPEVEEKVEDKTNDKKEDSKEVKRAAASPAAAQEVG